MHRSGSHRIYGKLVNTGYQEGSPVQGPGKARRGQVDFRKNGKLKPPRGALRGGGIYCNGVWGHQPPSHIFQRDWIWECHGLFCVPVAAGIV